MLRALAHPDRRLFVRACLGGERSAGALAATSSLALATVSEHLRVLRKSGLLCLNRSGRFWLYRTDRAVLASAARKIAALGKD